MLGSRDVVTELQVIGFSHFSFILWHHCCFVENFLSRSCPAVSQFLCLRTLSGAAAELYFSFSLYHFFLSLQRKKLVTLSDLWIRFWVCNWLMEALLIGSAGENRRGEEDFHWEAVVPTAQRGHR